MKNLKKPSFNYKEFFKKFFTWRSIKNAIVKWSKNQGVKLLLKKLAISGGIKGWLVTFVANHLIEAGDEYILEPVLVKLGYRKEVKDGIKTWKKLVSSQDVDDWRDNANDV